MSRSKFFSVAAVLAVAALGLAADPVGTWKGSMKFQIPKGAQAQMKGKTPTLEIELILSKSGAYVANQNGSAGSHRSEGMWKLKGDRVVLSPKLRDGKPVSGPSAEPKEYVLSKDGSTLTIDLSKAVRVQGGDGKHGKVTTSTGFKLELVLKRA